MVKIINFIGRHKNIKALFLYLFVISVFYAPVVFWGKTLHPPLYQPHGIVQGWPYGYNGRIPVNTFNIDLATPAYYEWPINKLVGDIYKKGELPLWNPYQGAGTPLAVQYSSRVFFPYQILENISPVLIWDYFLLGRLLIAGFFTYLFLRLLNLSFAASFLGGTFYMFSGAFTWFINLEQFTNNAMMVPVLLYCFEMLIQKSDKRSLAISAIAFGLVLLAGQPEVALYILFLSACYYIFRLFIIPKDHSIFKRIVRFLVVCILGFSLAAPLIIPFVEFMNHSHHIHKLGGDMGKASGPPWETALNLLTPTAHELFQDPAYYTYPLAEEKSPTSGKSFYFRFFPTNGEWDLVGGYTGIIPPFLALTGIFIILFKGYRQWKPHLLFFSLFGLSIVLKNFGVKPFLWLGYLPFFDQTWSQRWAGPVWTFCFAVGGAIGFQIIKEYFSNGVSPLLPEKDRDSYTRGKWIVFIKNVKEVTKKDIIKYPLIHIMLIWISLLTAYSNYKWWMRNMVGISLPPDVKSKITASFPVAIVLFFAVYLVITLGRNRKLDYLSLVQYLILLAIQAILINIFFYNGAKAVFIVQNLVLLYIVILLFLCNAARRHIIIYPQHSIVENIKTNPIFSLIHTNLSRWMTKPYSPPISALSIIFVIYIYLVFATFYKYTGISLLMKPFFVPSMVIGACITILLLLFAMLICLYYIKIQKGIYGFIPLGIMELWWAVPRGYNYEWLFLKAVPLIIGIFVIWTAFLEKWRMTVISSALFFISFTLLDLTAPHGFPDRYNPFTPAPYTDFIKKTDYYYRVMGGYGILYPNFSSAAGIQDIRYITALTPILMDNYRRKHLHIDEQEELNSAVLWFTGRPEYYAIRKKENDEPISYRPMEQDFKANLNYYSLLGVKYILLPSNINLNYKRYSNEQNEQDINFPLIYNKEIKIYENPYALPRAFIAYGIKYADTYKEAQSMLSNPGFNPKYQIVLEENAPHGYKNEASANSKAEAAIKEYSTNRVVIDASTEKAGILILSDLFYPGWSAYVDGTESKIYRVNGLIRGIFIEKGQHKIIFKYMPITFKTGLLLAFISLVLCTGLIMKSGAGRKGR